MRIVWRYWLLQIPGWLLLALVLLVAQRWLDFSFAIVWAVLAAWFLKDLLLYPALGDAYALREPEETNKLVGELATATEGLAPSGYVRLKGELWKAELNTEEEVVEAGETVRVLKVEGLTLRVTRL